MVSNIYVIAILEEKNRTNRKETIFGWEQAMIFPMLMKDINPQIRKLCEP